MDSLIIPNKLLFSMKKSIKINPMVNFSVIDSIDVYKIIKNNDIILTYTNLSLHSKYIFKQHSTHTLEDY